MLALLPRRAALAAIVAAGSLAIAAALIVRLTALSPTPEATDMAGGVPAFPPADRGVTAPDGAASVLPAVPSPLTANDVESERALAAEVRALVAAGQIGKARTLANTYYERFPRGSSSKELARLTGAHPRRDATDTRP
jgi:hypothetical protein